MKEMVSEKKVVLTEGCTRVLRVIRAELWSARFQKNKKVLRDRWSRRRTVFYQWFKLRVLTTRGLNNWFLFLALCKAIEYNRLTLKQCRPSIRIQPGADPIVLQVWHAYCTCNSRDTGLCSPNAEGRKDAGVIT